MSYSDDLDAINRYFRETPIKPFPNGGTNVEAFQIKDAFVRWYDALGWSDKTFTGQDVYDNARTRRNQFNLALAQTPAAKAVVRDQLATGIETEEMQGKPRPTVDVATGRVGAQVKKPTVAPTPSAMPNANTPVPTTLAENPPPADLPLVVGKRGDSVTKWQQFVGISPTTGYYGEATAGKTRNWQTSWNTKNPGDKLTVDGKVGKETWKRAFGGVTPAPSNEAFAPAPAPFSPTPAPAPIGPGGIPKPSASKPNTSKPAAKPSAAAKAKETATAVKVKTAGMLDVGAWPLWAKIGAGVTVVGGIAAALMGQHKNPPQYGMRRHRD